MIKSIQYVNNHTDKEIPFSLLNDYKLIIETQFNCNDSFTLVIEFTQSIVSFRNHDYSWVDCSQNRIASEFSSKILKLVDGTLVQPNVNSGIWEVKKENPNQLYWKFNTEFSNPITNYSGKNNIKEITSARNNFELNENILLLFSKQNAIEISRSKIPFTAIACFTDHCDYDTPENLKIQREFFKKINLKITKGFFLNHFSKRSDNASWQNNADELTLWQNDGHELCYHSLSQSIKPNEESFTDFKNFSPPLSEIPVWIDHGFQPYNFSFYKNNGFSDIEFEEVLVKNNIQILWNYIDCGIASNAIINQLNYNQFTLETYWESIKMFSFKTKIIKLIKAIIFHYDNNQNRIRNYIDSISAIRNLVKKKNLFELFNFISNIFPVIFMVIKSLINWKSIKNKPFKTARYSPIIFSHQIVNKTFTVFQTIELVDFINGLSKRNTDLLIQENGLFIAHTYFSVDMNHHQGKLFKANKTLDNNVIENFEYFAHKIKENKIWNPTLSELIAHLHNYKNVIFDIDEKGVIFIKNNSTIPSRIIQ